MKVIGITCAFDYDANYYFEGYPRMMLNEDYSRSIIEAGAIPLLIPVHSDYDVIYQQISLIDGLLLSGGQDVHPHLYHQDPHPLLGAISSPRDTFELLAIKAAMAQNKPILGICRGLQILNVYFGGSLYQDNSLKGNVYKHSQIKNPSLKTHYVDVVADSWLFKALSQCSIAVNSFHHQSIDQLADHFIISALAKDGIVEAIESKDKRIIATQWHPEMLSKEHEDGKAIFKYFINEVVGDLHE